MMSHVIFLLICFHIYVVIVNQLNMATISLLKRIPFDFTHFTIGNNIKTSHNSPNFLSKSTFMHIYLFVKNVFNLTLNVTTYVFGNSTCMKIICDFFQRIFSLLENIIDHNSSWSLFE